KQRVVGGARQVQVCFEVFDCQDCHFTKTLFRRDLALWIPRRSARPLESLRPPPGAVAFGCLAASRAPTRLPLSWRSSSLPVPDCGGAFVPPCRTPHRSLR